MRKVIKYAAYAGLGLTLAACTQATAPSPTAAAQPAAKAAKVSKAETNVKQPLAEAIDHVWAGQRVWFDFVEQNNHQMIAYYDGNRQMSVAMRKMRDVNGAPWSDPRTLEKVDVMVDKTVEQKMTYPEFFKDPKGELILKYRDGSSGNGRWFYSKWNAESGRWAHLHDTVLLSGENVRGIYPYGPVIGPDGFAHMTITWRETPIASSNHDLSYARSKDLINWESSDGSPIKLPIVLATGEIIDPIPEHGGLLNGRHPIGFDKQNRVLVSYQKYNDDKLSQVFINRREADGWVVKQVSDWDDLYVDLDKSGALDLPLLTNDPAYVNADGNIVVSALLNNKKWEWILDHDDLSVISGGIVEDALPDAITQYDLDNNIPQRVIPMMENQARKSSEYYISWEAMQPNRDQARPDIPPASTLRVHRIPK